MHLTGRSRPGARSRGGRLSFSRGDRWSAVALVLVPIALEVPFSLAGQLLLPGDDLTQNYPLRALAGEVIRSGHLPGWDPFIWSGTPLLAGWNTGAMFPGTWLFAVMPAVAAWTINLVLVSVVCGTGTFVLLRLLGCRTLPSLLGALAFTYTGFMSGQIVHIGLAEGTAFTPWMLAAVDRLARSSGADIAGRRLRIRRRSEQRPPQTVQGHRPSALVWGLVLAIANSLTVLAGDPRAVSSAGVIVGLFVLACWWRRRGHAARFLLEVLVASALGVLLSALQWLPGIAFLHGSQRGVSAYTFFGSGSLPLGEIGGLLALPFALGGNGNFGAPIYEGNYNLPEITIGVGLVALVAAFALLPDALGPLVRALAAWGRSRRRSAPDAGTESRGRPLGVWYLSLVVGIVLTLGTYTPFAHVLVHVPLFSGERLQNRNAAVFDLALCVLLAHFVDDLVGPAARDPAGAGTGTGVHRGPIATARRRALALVPIAWLAGLVACAYLAPVALEDMIGVTVADPGVERSLTPYLLATLALGLAIAVLVLAWHRLRPRVREIALVLFVLADIATYVTNASYADVPTSLLGASTPLSSSLARLAGPSGRFAIYNPSYGSTGTDPLALDQVGVTDINVLRHIATVQGYGSIVEGSYQNATATHEFEALDQTRLEGPTFDALDLQTLLTLPLYLQTPLVPHGAIPVAGARAVTVTGAPAANPDTPAVPAVTTGPWTLAPGGTARWVLASTYTIVRATIVLNEHAGTRPSRVVIGLGAPGAKLRSYPVTVSNGIAELELPTVRRAEELVVKNPTGAPAVVGAVVAVTRSPDERLLLDGALQGAVAPPHWQYGGALGPFVVFQNTETRGAAWLEASNSTSPSARLEPGGNVTTGATPTTGAQTMRVVTSKSALLVRSETYAPGWTARITPSAGGPTKIERVRQIGLVQAVTVPAGSSTITWRYAPTSLLGGLLLSTLGAVVTVALAGLWLRRRRRHLRAPCADRSPDAEKNPAHG